MQTYEDQSRTGDATLTKEEFEKRVDVMRDWVSRLVEAAGVHDVTGRWREQLDKILNNFDTLLREGGGDKHQHHHHHQHLQKLVPKSDTTEISGGCHFNVSSLKCKQT